MSAVPRAGEPVSVPTGNTFDKYGSTNPVVRRLMSGFEATLDELFSRAAPDSVLDVGCGEGVLTARWAARLRDRPVVGTDLDDSALRAQWDARYREHPELENLQFMAMPVERLAFEESSFDLVAAIEVLEHVPAPEAAVAELARIARRHVLVSVPREPLWRCLNVARGAYLRELGNTPGHVNHWSKRAFVTMLARHGRILEARSPFPWTMVLLELDR